MKARRRLPHPPFLAIAISLSAVVFPARSSALTDHYWNVGGTGGDGNWGTSPGDKNWNIVAGASAGNTAWPDTINDAAVFQDALGGTVTVLGDVQAGSISKRGGADYTINAGTIALLGIPFQSTPAVVVTTGKLTIDSVLVGNSGMNKFGGGNLVLSGANTYTGTTSLGDGTITLTGSLASATIEIAGGGTLLDESGGLSGNTALGNRGTLVVNAPETVATFLQDQSGAVLAGSGALTTTGGAIVRSGSISGTLLGDIDIAGPVNVSGTIGGGSLTVGGGTLTLTGSSHNTPVGISETGVLIDANGGLDSGAVVTNAGTLTVNAAESVSSYTQNGSGFLGGASALTGTGVLTASAGATLNGGRVTGSLLGNITSTGAVLVSGMIGGGSLAVTGGTLTLWGTSIGTPATISAGAELVDFNGGLDSTAIVTNAGTLTVESADTVTNYTQNGSGVLAGTRDLTASGGATLGGGTVSGHLLGDITNTGTVLVSGTIGAGSVAVTGGTLTLSGTSSNSLVGISATASLLDSNGGLDSQTILTNAGTLTVDSSDAIATYTQNGNGTLAGAADLTASNGATLNGGTVSGNLLGDITSTGIVLVSGTTGGGSLSVTGGTLTLTGTSTNTPVHISALASLVDSSGGLASNAVLTNSGILTVNAAEAVKTYISNGGSLTGGSGTLTTITSRLNNASTIADRLSAHTLTSNGGVSIIGTATADTIRIESGFLANSGTLGTTSTHLDIASGASLIAGGTQRYGLLTTSGSGTGTWQGNLNNSATLAPGGTAGAGTLRVTGDFKNSSAGILKMNVGREGHDLLDIGGTATFGGTLDLARLGASIDPWVPVQIVSASDYEGNITTLVENLDGAVLFNPKNGTVTRIASPQGNNALSGLTANQKSTWVSLYDDVIDSGTVNVTGIPGTPGKYDISSGVADEGNPDLLWALAASLTPTGLDADLLNHLSPEVYTGLADYATQATRVHQRTALTTPPLAAIRHADSKEGLGQSAKSSAKGAIEPPPAESDWVFFAATDYFNAETDNSLNHADYDLSGMGFIAGARTRITGQLQLGGYVAADDGSINDDLIDADETGWSLGLTGEFLLDEKSHTSLTAAASYGRYSFDGTRESASATSAGWMPDRVGFSNVESQSLELFVSVETMIYQNDRIRISPTAGLRGAFGSTDGFTESTSSAPGSAIALDVESNNHNSLLAEIGITAQADLSDRLTVQGDLGVNAGIGEDPHSIRATFVDGSRPMSAKADGLSDDLLFIGLGARYQISESIGIGLGYRAEIRPSHPTQLECRLSCSFRF